jgi:hypothetical protein
LVNNIYIGTAFLNMSLEELYKGQGDEEEDVSSYWMTFREQEGTAN